MASPTIERIEALRRAGLLPGLDMAQRDGGNSAPRGRDKRRQRIEEIASDVIAAMRTGLANVQPRTPARQPLEDREPGDVIRANVHAVLTDLARSATFSLTDQREVAKNRITSYIANGHASNPAAEAKKWAEQTAAGTVSRLAATMATSISKLLILTDLPYEPSQFTGLCNIASSELSEHLQRSILSRLRANEPPDAAVAWEQTTDLAYRIYQLAVTSCNVMVKALDSDDLFPSEKVQLGEVVIAATPGEVATWQAKQKQKGTQS